MVRKACCPKQGLNRGAWTSHEDKLLSEYIKVHGLGRWQNVPTKAGLNRCGKSCRLRWLNYLRPDIKRGNITEEEEDLIIRLHKLLGNRWSLIAGRLPGRTDNEIKNYWNTYLRKKVSGTCSEQHPSPKTNEVSFKNPQTADKECSEVNVIRTKAVRCTRTLFADQIPNDTVNNSPDELMPATPLGPNLFSDFNGNNTAPLTWNVDVDGFNMVETMQNSLFPQAAMDGSYMRSNSLHDTNGVEPHSCEIGDDEGLYSFLDADLWDSFVIPERF